MRFGAFRCHRSHSTATTSQQTSGVKIGRNLLAPRDEENGPVTWYACGPTVYDDAHLGHARTYVTTDLIRRIIRDYFELPVNFAMGITDIDDKIILKCESVGMKSMPEIKKFTEKMEKEFLTDMADLGVQRPDAILRVSEHIPDIIAFVENLIKGGYAYSSKDGVYFAYTKLPPDHHYDRFGNLGSTTDNTSNPSEADDPSGVVVTHDKHDSRDFALWKLCREGQEEIGWDSPWGRGRPGWHIECSTMTYQYFGTRLDIHSGGIDLQFPHHANEIAQRYVPVVSSFCFHIVRPDISPLLSHLRII